MRDIASSMMGSRRGEAESVYGEVSVLILQATEPPDQGEFS